MKAPLRLCLPLCSYSTTVCTLHTHPPVCLGCRSCKKKKLGGLELRLHRVKQTSVVFSRLEVSSQHYIAGNICEHMSFKRDFFG